MPSTPTNHPPAPSDAVRPSVTRRSPLSAELREGLRAKRRRLGLSLRRTAQLLGVHVSSLSHWESGKVQWLSSEKLAVIQAFLAGRYDPYVEDLMHPSSETFNSLIQIVCQDSSLARVLRGICDTYLLIQDDRRASRLFLEQIQDIINQTITRLNMKRLSEAAGHDRSSESL